MGTSIEPAQSMDSADGTYKTPEELDRNFVKKYIEQVTVTFLDDGQAEISLTMKTDEWKQMLSRIEVEGTDSGTKE